MSRLNEIVTIINNNLVSNSFNVNQFKPSKVKCIAELYRKENKTLPGVIDFSGNIDYVGADDAYNFQMYHRVLSANFDDDVENEYGNKVYMHEVSNMILVVMYDITKVKVRKEDVMALIADGWTYQFTPTQLTALDIIDLNITGGDFVTNSDEVFANEYGEGERKPEWVFFSFNYTIETNNKKGCYSIC